ncbi:hypothetical protein M2161_000231 [Streptomyces sp. SAI-133]|nr:hypothetical protein [Streptomyces sp. SAI-133]
MPMYVCQPPLVTPGLSVRTKNIRTRSTPPS